MIEVEKKFNLNNEEIARLVKNAEFVKEIIIHDTYFDTDDYKLTLKDMWLRNRDGHYELKVPPVGTKDYLFSKYQELTTNKEIIAALNFPSDREIADSLSLTGLKPFATFVSTRRKYKLDDFNIDIDSIDYGYNLAEIELMVEKEEDVPLAKDRIANLAKDLGLEIKITRGKLTEYMARFKQTHHKALIDAGVLKL